MQRSWDDVLVELAECHQRCKTRFCGLLGSGLAFRNTPWHAQALGWWGMRLFSGSNAFLSMAWGPSQLEDSL